MSTELVAASPPVVVRPYRVAYAEVLRVSEVTPHMRRVTLGGPDLAGVTSAGLDQRIKVLLPQQGQPEPMVARTPDWYARHQQLPEELRPVLRTYTVRAFRPAEPEMDVDFVLHGDTGPATRWAARARPGDRLVVVAPDVRHDLITGYEFRPPATAAWTLLAGDETALPALGSIVESLPDGHRALVFAEVRDAKAEQALAVPRGVELTWVRRDRGQTLLDVLRARELPQGPGYAWLAGEASAIRDLRRHLVAQRGFAKDEIYFAGYWRFGERS
ncbi:siderophore-interacting protein [Amycolatopsis jiangsuensis]|uniref:NADPH-dependent ferric siderophore reductase n=1 Tax=Amycolatopsis jiangsuensis TaxID=1181879 RepID=A0A840IY63_9PSEU|nr:siderophore-interacting protein [Amycolatopsis jiangsuensis]MBB4685804.1 NADPH-dependent ferric siderophore reductase [Amycolatopsis jiangsuensis]